jgi:two-component system OmpR family response regulator
MRILIAEDDQVLADGLLRSLRASGYAVDQVAAAARPTRPWRRTSSTC